jgi:uncharacterized protein (TIGR02677 family)
MRYSQANGFVYPQEVLDYLLQTGAFNGYSIDDVKRDLEQLEQWGNLKSRQDPRSPDKLEDFIKKRYQYMVSDITVGFEQFLEKLEQKRSKITGSMDSSLTVRLLEALYALKDYHLPENRDKKINQEVYELFSDVFYRFENLQQETISYLAHIDHQKIQQEMAKGERAFLLFKDDFVTYLQDFVLSLHRTIDLIISVSKEIEQQSFIEMLLSAAEHKCYRDRFIQEALTIQEQIDDFHDQWFYMMEWFSSSSKYHNGGFESLLRQTEETIDHIVKFIKQIAEKFRQVKNRQHEYLHAAKLFHSLDKTNMDVCHQIFAYLFGVPHTKHIKAHYIDSDQQKHDIWESDGEKVHLLSKYRERKERKKRTALQVDETAKRRLLAQYEQERKLQLGEIFLYLSGKVIRLKDLGPIPSCVREEILDWLNRCSYDVTGSSVLRNGITDDGRTFEVRCVTNEKVHLLSEDGTLEIDDLEFSFEEVN